MPRRLRSRDSCPACPLQVKSTLLNARALHAPGHADFLTHNAFWLEPNPDGKSMRGYFMAESDNQAELLIYDAIPWVNR